MTARHGHRVPQAPYGKVWMGGVLMTHTAAVKVLRETFRDGQRCPRCHRPMRYWQKLDGGHVIARMLGGGAGPLRLEHARCNRSAGATMGNAARTKQAQVAGIKAAARKAAVKSKWA